MLNWQRLRRRSVFQLMDALGRLARACGAEQSFGRLVGSLHYAVATSQRRALLAWMTEIYPQTDSRWRAATLRAAYRNSDGAAFEILGLYRRQHSPAEIAARCSVAGEASLRAALQQGRGVLLVGLHAGNGMLPLMHLAQRGLPITAVYRESRKVPPGFFDQLFNRHGVETICVQRKPRPDELGEDKQSFRLRLRARAFRAMLRALQQNRILVVLMDQGMRYDGVDVRFLGRAVTMAAGPAQLAHRTGAQIVPMQALGAGPCWQYRFGDPLPLECDAEATTQAIARQLESFVLRHPELWTWHHRRWARPDAQELPPALKAD
jgi:lauroyl/myristoyl acyltransferase